MADATKSSWWFRRAQEKGKLVERVIYVGADDVRSKVLSDGKLAVS